MEQYLKANLYLSNPSGRTYLITTLQAIRITVEEIHTGDMEEDGHHEADTEEEEDQEEGATINCLSMVFNKNLAIFTLLLLQLTLKS